MKNGGFVLYLTATMASESVKKGTLENFPKSSTIRAAIEHPRVLRLCERGLNISAVVLVLCLVATAACLPTVTFVARRYLYVENGSSSWLAVVAGWGLGLCGHFGAKTISSF